MRRVRRASPGLGVGLAALLLAIAAQAAPLVEAEPSRVVLGAGTQVRITVRGAGGALHGVASAGTLVSTGTDGATEHFLWTPPEPRAPFVAVMAFWEGGPLSLGSVTTLTLPCSGRIELSIDTEPTARVTVEISGAHFGPRRADPRGHSAHARRSAAPGTRGTHHGRGGRARQSPRHPAADGAGGPGCGLWSPHSSSRARRARRCSSRRSPSTPIWR